MRVSSRYRTLLDATVSHEDIVSLEDSLRSTLSDLETFARPVKIYAHEAPRIMSVFFVLPQCRERWCHHLDPSVNHGSWTDEEDRLLLSLKVMLMNGVGVL